MFAPLNASMLNTGPASLGLSVIASSNAEIKASAVRIAGIKKAEATGIAKTNNPTPIRLAGYKGSIVGIADHVSVQNKIVAGYGSLIANANTESKYKNATKRFNGETVGLSDVEMQIKNATVRFNGESLAKAITEAQFKNATVRFKGETLGLAESWGDTLRRTEIGYGIWVAEAEASSKLRLVTKRMDKANAVAVAYQKSKADRLILLSSTVCGLADVFAWRLLASYRPANSRRRLILNR